MYRVLIPVSFLLTTALIAGQPRLEIITLGGSRGWPTPIVQENVRFEQGWNGGEDILLKDWSPEVTESSDLILETEAGITDATGRYRIGTKTAFRTDAIARYGQFAIFFDGSSMLELIPDTDDAMFSAMEQVRRFTIDLWLYPMTIHDGARVISWSGTRFTAQGIPHRQQLLLEFRDKRLVWKLENLFLLPDEREFTVELSSRQVIVPDRWQHHQLRFDDRTGAIVYLIDGRTEAIRYANAAGVENGESWSIHTGSECEDGLLLGDRMIGIIDDFSISRAADAEQRSYQYDGRPGTVTTDLVDLGQYGSIPEQIEVKARTPGNTAVEVYYRLADTPVAFSPFQTSAREWIRVPPGGMIDGGQSGRFIQLQARLYADAGHNDSPVLQQIRIHTRKIPPPIPPAYVAAESVPGGVRLYWDAVRAREIAGYRVYLGTQRGRYTGADGLESPVDVGVQTELFIDLPEAGRPYVFAVESYDMYGQVSLLSREQEARAGGEAQ